MGESPRGEGVVLSGDCMYKLNRVHCWSPKGGRIWAFTWVVRAESRQVANVLLVNRLLANNPTVSKLLCGEVIEYT